MSYTEYDAKTDWNETGNETPVTVITGNFGEMYTYDVVGYLSEETNTYSWFDVFVDDDLGCDEECINLGQVLANETDALTFFINWVAKEIKDRYVPIR